MASAVSGTVARETKSMEHARDTEQGCLCCKCPASTLWTAKALELGGGCQGTMGTIQKDATNLPDMRSLACASPRMLNLRIPGP